MNSLIYSNTALGFSAETVMIECHLSNGLPTITIVGMGNKSVEEAKERLRSAFASTLIQLPKKHIVLNLAPADLPKAGSSFDLAMAASILCASGSVKDTTSTIRLVVYGELGLTGEIRPVRGIIGRLLQAQKQGFDTAIIPSRNYQQAALVKGIQLVPLSTLRELFDYLGGGFIPRLPSTNNNGHSAKHSLLPVVDFSHIVGQRGAKRAAEIAAAGGHNLLLDGPPGSGKSMLAKAMPGIMPPLTMEEIVEITHLNSLSGSRIEDIVQERPVQSPHHSTSATAILGGGSNPRPGAISLSHKGVLFLDELPEFGRHIIDSLRQPLEDKKISVARAKMTVEYPADCLLVATRNPCPCGYYGTGIECTCMPHAIAAYQKRISGPILDRIDLFVSVSNVDHQLLLSSTTEELSSVVRGRVIQARARQTRRFDDASRTNALMTNQEIKRLVRLNAGTSSLLNSAATRLHLSARSYMRLIKVARTIADLEDQDEVTVNHMAEALQYRQKSTTSG